MNAFLGVSQSTKRLSIKQGEESFWCVFNSNKAEQGDLLFLYFTSIGIQQLYVITAQLEKLDTNNEISCQYRNMKTVRIRLFYTLNEPITVTFLKSHPKLKYMAAIGRNFQLTNFALRPSECKELLTLIQKTDPMFNGESLK